MGDVLKVARLSDGEDKKRDGDREYTITERLDASLVHAAFLSPRGLITTSRRCSGLGWIGQLRPQPPGTLESTTRSARTWGWLATPRTGWS